MGKVIHIRYRENRRGRNMQPMAAMNITPLIDVMLVLLVMLILAVPLATHQVTVDLAQGPIPKPERPPVTQKLLLLDNGTALWNGAPISDEELKSELLVAAAADDTLKMQTQANARYERFDQLIAMVKGAEVKNLGFVGNHAFREWDKQ